MTIETRPENQEDKNKVLGFFGKSKKRVDHRRCSSATGLRSCGQCFCGHRGEHHQPGSDKSPGGGASLQRHRAGATIGVDLQPGETIDVVLSANPVVPDTYSIHPESSPCPWS